MFVIPSPGLKVPDPARMGGVRELYFLPPEGREVGDADALYWARRIQDGEVTVQAPAGPDDSLAA